MKLRLKIRKITFSNNQAWIVLEDDGKNYCGTWHCKDKRVVDYLRLEDPEFIDMIKLKGGQNGEAF